MKVIKNGIRKKKFYKSLQIMSWRLIKMSIYLQVLGQGIFRLDLLWLVKLQLCPNAQHRCQSSLHADCWGYSRVNTLCVLGGGGGFSVNIERHIILIKRIFYIKIYIYI